MTGHSKIFLKTSEIRRNSINSMIREWSALRELDLYGIRDMKEYWYDVIWHPESLCEAYPCSHCPMNEKICDPDPRIALKDNKVFGKIFYAFLKRDTERYKQQVNVLLGMLVRMLQDE